MPAAAELQALLSWRLYRTETSPPVLSPVCGVQGPADARVCSPARQRSWSPPPELPPPVVYHNHMDSPVAATGAARQRSCSPPAAPTTNRMHQRSWSPPVLRTHSSELQHQHPAQRYVQFKMHDDGHCQAGDSQHVCSECQQLRMQNIRLLERLQEKEWAEQEIKARLELMEQQHQAQLVRIRRQLSTESQSCRRLIVKLHDLQHVVNALEQGQSARPKKHKGSADLGKVGLSTRTVSNDDDAKRGSITSREDVHEKAGNRPKAGTHGLKWRIMPTDGNQRRPNQQQQQMMSQRSLHQAPETQHASVEMTQRLLEHHAPESQHPSVEMPQRAPQHQGPESHYASVETMQYDGDCSTGVSAKIPEVTKHTGAIKVAELPGSSQSTSQGGSEGSSLTHEFSGFALEEEFSALPHRAMQRNKVRSLSVDSLDPRTHPAVRDVCDPRTINCSRDPRARALRDPRVTVWCKPAEPTEEKATTVVAPLRRR